MASYTTYYNLDKYDSLDRPNLRDQYNSAMDKIDAELHTQAGNVATQAVTVGQLQTTVTQQAADIASATTTATGASNAAQQAASVAGTAATAATAAQAAADAVAGRLGPVTVHRLGKHNEGSKWTWIGAAANTYGLNAVIVEPDDSTQYAFAVIKLDWNYTSEIPASDPAWTSRNLFQLVDWVGVSGEGVLLEGAVEGRLAPSVQSAYPNTELSNAGIISWTHFRSWTDAIPSNTHMHCILAGPVRRRSA